MFIPNFYFLNLYSWRFHHDFQIWSTYYDSDLEMSRNSENNIHDFF